MQHKMKITPCLWFDHEAEQAAAYYVDIFPNSSITDISRYSEVGREIHGKILGTAMVVAFELDGQPFTALNGGPAFRFNQAISLQIDCRSQDEVDHYWARLSAEGDPAAQQCGWLKDRYGVSWQVVPGVLPELINGPDPAGAGRAMQALLQMKKLDIATLKRAYLR